MTTAAIIKTSLYDRFADVFKKQQSESWLDENDLREQKQLAYDSFVQLGFPTTKLEDWRFTNLTPFLKDDFEAEYCEGLSAAINADQLKQYAVDKLDTYTVVLVNGVLDASLSCELPASVSLLPIKEAVAQEGYHSFLNQRVNIATNAMAALNTAMFSEGFALEVKANAVVDKPIHIIHLYTNTQNTFMHPRHWIIVRKNADVKILETFSKTDNGALLWINGVTEIFMEENAHADHHVLQNDIPDTRWTNYTQVAQHSNSLFNNYTFTLPGAQLVRNNLHVSLDQSATETHLYGLYLASENQLVDNHTFVDHRMPHCWSNELYKGVMTDKSKAVFNGKIYVHVDAQKTNAFQQNNNMLLSDKATVDTKPQLEIYADDVKCSHGSTVGQFNNEALFYLQARGINKKTARRMMVGAFAFDVVEKVKLEPLQHHIEKLIASNLEQWYE